MENKECLTKEELQYKNIWSYENLFRNFDFLEKSRQYDIARQLIFTFPIKHTKTSFELTELTFEIPLFRDPITYKEKSRIFTITIPSIWYCNIITCLKNI